MNTNTPATHIEDTQTPHTILKKEMKEMNDGKENALRRNRRLREAREGGRGRPLIQQAAAPHWPHPLIWLSVRISGL